MRLAVGMERERAKAIAAKGERVYRRLRRRLERKYPGMAVAIDWREGEVAAIGRSLDEADEKAAKARPGKTFYFRKIGGDIFVFLNG